MSADDPTAESQLQPGGHLGPYTILGAIGAGGMGQVYRARDTRLDRIVAIKASAARFSGRFDGEARTIAALNHPNICTIFDVGPNYLVMEFVEGETIYQMMAERRLTVEEVLRYATQIAAAMQAAHAAGVVHRDLKPGNVMVTVTGLVKVLDFGLAKMTQHPSAKVAESDATATLAASPGLTMAGTIMGSPSYMSPEQARSKPLDARSDIFSFGSLVFEMLTGQKAFPGDTALEVLSGILHLEVPPPSSVNPKVSHDLNLLVARCLHKNPALRFQSMAEVQWELNALAGSTSTTGPTLRLETKPKRIPWIAITAAGLVAAAAASLLIWRFANRVPENSGGAPEMVRVTSDPGLNIDPTISSDGKLVAYSSDRSGEGNLDIWVRQIGGGDPIRLTRDPADDVEPNFSPDSTHVVFRSGRAGGGIYVVPTTGGEQRRITDAGRRPQFSPDGREVMYWTGPADPFPLRDGIGKIFVLDLETSTTRQIRPDFVAAVDPVWSPDGKKILFVGAKDSTVKGFDWWITPLDGGPAVSCPVMPLGQLFNPFAWQGDQVYFTWEGLEVQTIGRIAINASKGRPAGKPRRLTASTADAYSPAVSKTGQVVFSVVERATNIYEVPLDSDSGKTKGSLLRLSKERGSNEPISISADGKRLAFISDRTGVLDLWVRDLATAREHALSEGGRAKATPEISRDGSLVAWREALGGKNAFVTPFDGGPNRQLCSNCGAVRAWSPNGEFLLFDQSSGSIGLMEFASGKVSSYLNTANLNLHARSISADGKWLAFTANRNAVDFAVYVAPFAPLLPPARSTWIRIISSPDVDPDPRWSPNGNLLYFSSERDGYNCIWALRLNPETKHPEGKLFPVQHFHSPSLLMSAPSFRYQEVALARDKLAVSLEERSGGIWMVALSDPSRDGNGAVPGKQ